MSQSCLEGQYMDRLLRECVSCSMICHNSEMLTRCSEFCVAWSCKAVSGQFYDTLLKKCLKCSELCGSHPAACADACRSVVPVTQRPVGGSAVQLVTDRGRSASGSALYSEALLYSLLGLCITALVFTLTAAFLLLLKRTKQQQQQLDTKKQQPNKHGQSSKDSLMARAEEVSQDRPKATETCVYCFTEHVRAPETPGRHHANGALHHPVQTHTDKTGPFRIICSPTQTSI